MIEVNIPEVNQIENSLVTYSQRLQRLNNEVNDISNYINSNFTMGDIYHKLQRQIETIDFEIDAMRKMSRCLHEIISVYSGREDVITSFLEESQLTINSIEFTEFLIPDGIFTLLR